MKAYFSVTRKHRNKDRQRQAVGIVLDPRPRRRIQCEVADAGEIATSVSGAPVASSPEVVAVGVFEIVKPGLTETNEVTNVTKRQHLQHAVARRGRC